MATKKTPKQPKPKKFEALIKKALEYNPNKKRLYKPCITTDQNNPLKSK